MKLVIATAINIVGGLVLESWGAHANLPFIETFVGVITLAHLGCYFVHPPKYKEQAIHRSTLLICLALATFGEIVLSAVIGLYRYRTSFLPLFVPPGHVLLFLSGLKISEQNWFGTKVATSILAVGGLASAHSFLNSQDLLSVPLFIALIVFCFIGTDRKLYAVMFALAWLLEIIGTSLGAWRWEPIAPYLHLSAGNPPLAAGAFYACLDLLTLKTETHFVKRLTASHQTRIVGSASQEEKSS